MLEVGEKAPPFSLSLLDGRDWAPSGKSALLVFFQSDCPTCLLALPYLNRLQDVVGGEIDIMGISQDAREPTVDLAERLPIRFPVALDGGLEVSLRFEPLAVPTLFLLGPDGEVLATLAGFDKDRLNAIARLIGGAAGLAPFELAGQYDGAPRMKPGCASRHLEPGDAAASGSAVNPYSKRGSRASRIVLEDGADPHDYCMRAGFADPLPVVPPTSDRVERMLERVALAPEEIVALVPPNYGAATVEKIAANAVMAGCGPDMMPVLITALRAACDERFNLHGVQATTHFAAPLVIVNGPIRGQLAFACGSNAFSNVARANSNLGRALQLILTNLGGARPGEIDMSTLGNPGKFSYCIAENEEESPWDPLHVELGFRRDESAITLFAAEPPRGVSEHNARSGRVVLKAIGRALATVFSYRVCAGIEALVVLCPEHVKTLAKDGFTKRSVRDFLWENTGVPVKEFEADYGEGSHWVHAYTEATIDGERCYRKFPEPDAIKIIVCGGTAGKFSAVIGSWAAGSRGSEMVTYPICGFGKADRGLVDRGLRISGHHRL